jgi:predicted  nucleic acid-binding Zn-ribbon protein
LDYQQIGTESKTLSEQENIEIEIKRLWDKIRKASEVIFMLRDEIQTIKNQNSELQQKYEDLKTTMGSKEQEYARIRAEYTRLGSNIGGETFSPQEKEALKNRILELIAKINSHL